METQIITSAKQYLANNWGVDEIAEVNTNSEDAYQKLLDKIAWVIDYLIEKDIERLFWMLYRIDVSEKKVRETLDFQGPDNAAMALAELVLEREIEKAKTRASFKSQVYNNTIDDEEERW